MMFPIKGNHQSLSKAFLKYVLLPHNRFLILLLDEFNSIQWTGGRWRLKKSFGTATKIWGTNTYANISTYAKVAILGFIAFRDPIWMERLEAHVEEGKQIPKAAIEAIERIQR